MGSDTQLAKLGSQWDSFCLWLQFFNRSLHASLHNSMSRAVSMSNSICLQTDSKHQSLTLLEWLAWQKVQQAAPLYSQLNILTFCSTILYNNTQQWSTLCEEVLQNDIQKVTNLHSLRSADHQRDVQAEPCLYQTDWTLSQSQQMLHTSLCIGDSSAPEQHPSHNRLQVQLSLDMLIAEVMPQRGWQITRQLTETQMLSLAKQ